MAFLLICFLAFSVPGIFILSLSKYKFKPWEKIFLGSIVGFVAFSLLAYILILVNLTALIIPITLAIDVAAAKTVIQIFKSVKTVFNKKLAVLIAVFILGIFIQMAVITPSGSFKNGDILFWSAHGHDGAWHIALMEEIKNGWPFENPVFAGNRLVNYHFFSDITPAIFSKYLWFSNLDLYFRFFPFVFSLFLGVSTFILTKEITKNTNSAVWATIFTYFAGSFGYIVTFLKDKSIGGESIFWATQPQSSSGNPPQIISNFMFLAFLYLVYLLYKKHDKVLFSVAALILGSLAVFKIYAAVVLFGAVGIAGLWQVVKDRKIYLLALGLVSGILAAVLYLPNTSGSFGFLIFEPWWYIRTMIVEPSRLDWLDHELRRQTYIYENNFKRVVYLETIGFLIFFFGNLGMRFVGLLEILKSRLILISAIALSLILPLLFLQKGVASNTSQFLQYFVLLFGILAGISTEKIIHLVKPKFVKVLVALIIITLSVPTQIGLLKSFYSRDAYTKISKYELEALNFMKENSADDSIIITPAYDQYLNLGDKIPHIWDWFDTSYVSAFSSRRTYMDDYEQIDIMGYDYRERYEIKKAVFTAIDPQIVKQKLSLTKSNFLYFPKPLAPKVNLESIGLMRVFENQEVEIWKI